MNSPAILVFARGLSVPAFRSRLVRISGYVYRGYQVLRGGYGCIQKRTLGLFSFFLSHLGMFARGKCFHFVHCRRSVFGRYLLVF